MARTYLIHGKMTPQRKREGVNFIEAENDKFGRRYSLGWTNGSQTFLIRLTRDVYNMLRLAFRGK